MKMTELWSDLSLVVDLSVRLPVINRLKCKTCNVADKDVRLVIWQTHDVQFCVSDMQQQKQQLNLNAPVCVPAGPSQLSLQLPKRRRRL